MSEQFQITTEMDISMKTATVQVNEEATVALFLLH